MHIPSRRACLLACVALLFALATAPTVLGHAGLEQATPADGAAVEGQPAEVSGTYSQDIDPDGSSMQLRDDDGTVIAEGSPDPADARRMAITDLPALSPGEYEVRWVTLSAEDGELDRDTWTFTVVAAPTPAPSPTTAPAASTSAAATAAPSALPSPTVGPSPSPSGGSSDPTAGDGGDVVLPILAGLAIVVIAGGLLLGRRRGAPPA